MEHSTESQAFSLFHSLMASYQRDSVVDDMSLGLVLSQYRGQSRELGSVPSSQRHTVQCRVGDSMGAGSPGVLWRLGGDCPGCHRDPWGLTAWLPAGSWAGVARAAASLQKASAPPCSCLMTSRRCESRCECACHVVSCVGLCPRCLVWDSISRLTLGSWAS